MIIIISLCVVFRFRLETLESRITELTRRVNEISTALWIDSCNGMDAEDKVSQEQIEEAYKRAGLRYNRHSGDCYLFDIGKQFQSGCFPP